MPSETEQPMSPRTGSSVDLARRMDRIEARYDELSRQVSGLTGTVERVELNQKHSDELNVLRFNSLDTAIKTIDGTLERFMGRINAIVSGELKLPQAQQGEELVREYLKWRGEVDKDREDQAVMNGQMKLLGRLAVVLLGGNALAIVGALTYLVAHP